MFFLFDTNAYITIRYKFESTASQLKAPVKNRPGLLVYRFFMG